MNQPIDPIRDVLRERFALDDFRPWQREAIDAALADGSRVLVVAPTGGGKSLTYQLPATLLPGTTLVISPLVALMEDQVRSLEQRGIAATYLASTLDPDVRYAREAWLRLGRYKLVYLAPERLANDAFVEMLARLDVPLVAIDEAHCIAHWGHDFRPDYLRIGALLDRLRPRRVLACTATATPEVRREIREQLGFVDGPATREVLRGFARPNLHLAAHAVDGPTEARTRTLDALKAALGSPNRPAGGAIVYAATRKNTELVADVLRGKGWNAAAYHAGFDGDARSRIASAFAGRTVDVVVATNAFGMGIDRADIRAVVHVQPPASIEAYYQEVGRAGRDGREAAGLLLCSGMDIALRRRLSASTGEGDAVDPRLAERNWRLFRDLLRYLDAGTCRHDFVLRYFGDERELLGGCGHCDVCAALDGADGESDEAAGVRAATVARMALAGVARAKGRAGIQAIAEMLAGVRGTRTERFGFTTLSTFGLLKAHKQEWVVALLRALLAAGWIDLTASEHPVPLVTAAGWAVMKSSGAVRLRLPAERAVKRAGGSATGTRASAPREIPADVDTVLLERLKAWRSALAKERAVPAYVIALDRTLHEVAARKPASLGELPGIHGLGPARIESFGEQIVRIVNG